MIMIYFLCFNFADSKHIHLGSWQGYGSNFHRVLGCKASYVFPAENSLKSVKILENHTFLEFRQ